MVIHPNSIIKCSYQPPWTEGTDPCKSRSSPPLFLLVNRPISWPVTRLPYRLNHPAAVNPPTPPTFSSHPRTHPTMPRAIACVTVSISQVCDMARNPRRPVIPCSTINPHLHRPFNHHRPPTCVASIDDTCVPCHRTPRVIPTCQKRRPNPVTQISTAVSSVTSIVKSRSRPCTERF